MFALGGAGSAPRRPRWGLWLVLSAGLLPLLFVAWAAVAVYRPEDPGSRAETRVVVRPGMTADGVANLLRRDGIIRSAWWFRALVRVRHDAPLLQAGTYLFGRGMGIAAILRALVDGRVAVVRVVVPEGWTTSRVVSALTLHHLGPRRGLLAAARASVVLRQTGLPLPGRGVRFALEGYLFPATYDFPLGATPLQVMSIMVHRFQQAWTPALARTAARRTRLTMEETVTLASIVQSEVRSPSEMAVVAGVYLNRIRRGMDLNADPTVLYGLGLLGTQTSALTAAELASHSPYNTYRRRGWPPGPICNPGLAALRAAADPARVSALYFLTTPSGRLVLASSLRQQIANAHRYGVG